MITKKIWWAVNMEIPVNCSIILSLFLFFLWFSTFLFAFFFFFFFFLKSFLGDQAHAPDQVAAEISNAQVGEKEAESVTVDDSTKADGNSADPASNIENN